MFVYPNAVIYLALMVPAIVLGFWTTYFSVLDAARPSIHVHGTLMALWVVMLMSQAWSIRAGFVAGHRLVGRVSYVIAPLIFWSGLVVSHEMLQRGQGTVTPDEAQLLTFPLGGLLSFAVTYLLAIYYRKQRRLHARYMVSTGLAIIGGAVVRIYLFWLPGFGTLGRAANSNFVTLELIASLLLWRDWRSNGPRTPFLVLLALLGGNHLIFDLASDWSWWWTVAEGFYAWPNLSPWGPPI